MKGLSWLGWAALAVLAAFCIGTIALHRGETISAMWLVVAAVSTFTIAFRFYGLYIANNALGIDPTRATPASLAWSCPTRASSTRSASRCGASCASTRSRSTRSRPRCMR